MKDNTEQTIEFFEADIEYQLDRLDDIRLWLTNLVLEEKCGIEKIQYIFCTDEYLLGINKQYLEHDYYTDIITFPRGLAIALTGHASPLSGARRITNLLLTYY